MKKDFKTGMLLGLAITAVATFWLCTRERFSIKSQLLGSQKSLPSAQPADNHLRYQAALPNSFTAEQKAVTQKTISTGLENSSKQTPTTVRSNSSTDEQNTKTQTSGIHIVSEGENLSSIAERYYGSSNEWSRIFEANRSRLKNPNQLRAGMRLIIP
ncbi:LysM peptidoglycan-binding domain-containing protein [Planctomycetota bacterium]